jgi:hypothetical protein
MAVATGTLPEIDHGSAETVRDHSNPKSRADDRRPSPCPPTPSSETGVRAEMRRPDDFMMVMHLFCFFEGDATEWPACNSFNNSNQPSLIGPCLHTIRFKDLMVSPVREMGWRDV